MDQIYQDAERTLYPRLVLYEAIAKFKGEHERRRPSSDGVMENRRNFLDSFAYLCDIEKGGSTVTAAGLQKLEYSNILWLAANEGVRWVVKGYAENILRILTKVDPTTESAIRDQIFQLVVERCTPRLAFYKYELRTSATKCRMELRKELPDDTATAIRRDLRKLSEPRTLTLARIVDLCYDMRADQVNTIRRRSTTPQDDFGRLSHYIGRLGATRSAVNTVVGAMCQDPALRQISQIRFIEAPDNRMITLNPKDIKPYDILWQVCNESSSLSIIDTMSALYNLVDLDLPTYGGMGNALRANLAARRTIVTRVHAELQIGDRFSRQRFEFLDGDRYIGCSKPACYFCYNWLSCHKHKYVQPATHHKIIPGCRGPDNDINESGAAVLKEMYTKMTARVGQDILAFLLNMRSGNEAAGERQQYMSTEGTSRAPSRVSFAMGSNSRQEQVR